MKSPATAWEKLLAWAHTTANNSISLPTAGHWTPQLSSASLVHDDGGVCGQLLSHEVYMLTELLIYTNFVSAVTSGWKGQCYIDLTDKESEI